MAEMDLKDKEKMLFPFRTRAMRSDEEYIKEGTWKDGAPVGKRYKRKQQGHQSEP